MLRRDVQQRGRSGAFKGAWSCGFLPLGLSMAALEPGVQVNSCGGLRLPLSSCMLQDQGTAEMELLGRAFWPSMLSTSSKQSGAACAALLTALAQAAGASHHSPAV